jgi:hypothetical protein
MEPLRPVTPVTVPIPGETGAGFSGDVTVQQVSGPSALDTKPDARQGQAATPAPEGGAAPAAETPGQAQAPGAQTQPANPAKPQAASDAKNGKKKEEKPKKSSAKKK